MTASQVQTLMEAGDFSSASAILAAQLGGSSSVSGPKQKAERLETLYLSAVCARYQDDLKRARAYIQQIFEMEPFFGRGFLEEAHICRVEGRAREALSNYQRASEANPTLLAAWREQVKILQASGQVALANFAQGELAHYEAMPQSVLRAAHFLHEGRVLKAEKQVKAHLLQHPQDVPAIQLLADISARVGAYEEAEYLLRAAMQLAPDNLRLMTDFMLLMRKQQKFDQSAEISAQLLALAPENNGVVFQNAIEHMQHGDNQAAVSAVDALLVREPHNPAFHLLRGHIQKAMGQHDDAVSAYRQAISVRNDNGQAFYALANLKTYRFSKDEIIVMNALLDDGRCSLDDRVHLHFSLAAAHEKAKAHETAFRHYDEGNRLKRAQSRYTPDVMQAELQAQRAACTADLFDKQGGKGHAAPDPICIVGLPRAGSTLIEHILASHRQIDGTLELPNILSLAHRLRGKRRSDNDGAAYPQNLHDVSGDELAQMGRDFIEETKLHRQGAAFFTDKMPNNFRHIGLIHLILPNAKIIDARRDPMDCCFSGFKQLFAQGQEFTYGLQEIGRYYADYVALMEHWHAVLPGKILHVQHEDVLDDLDGQVRRMLDYLGLPFEQACLDFHQTERAVRTASSAQVRQPLNRKGVGAWRPFEVYLDPLKQALGNHYDPARYQQENRHE